MLVRPAQPADVGEIHRVHVAAAQGPDSLHRDEADVKAWLAERQPDDYRDEMRTQKFVVAEQDGRVIGFGAIDLGKRTITSVYVQPASTRRGVGRAIVQQLETLAIEAGLDDVTLQAAGGALQFYHKIGYQYVAQPENPPTWAEMTKRF